MEDIDDDEKKYAQISVTASFWSFYRLLQKAQTPETGTYTWPLETPGEGQWKRAISFSIKEDPWAVFRSTDF